MSKISHGLVSPDISGVTLHLDLRIVGQIIGTIISSVVMVFLGAVGWRASLLQRLRKIHLHMSILYMIHVDTYTPSGYIIYIYTPYVHMYIYTYIYLYV